MKTVLITGVSRGIGRALASKFLNQNYFVIGTSTSGKINFSHQNLTLFQLDLANNRSIEECANKILGLGKNIDILINNAGVWIDTDTGPSIDMPSFKKTLQINLVGQVAFTQKLLPVMVNGGHIVNVSSRQGSLQYVDASNTSATTSDPAYRISKAGLNMFTRILALELKGKVTVSSVHPGSVKTDMGMATATMEPEEAAEYVYKLAISKPETGQFWYKGEKFPW